MMALRLDLPKPGLSITCSWRLCVFALCPAACVASLEGQIVCMDNRQSPDIRAGTRGVEALLFDIHRGIGQRAYGQIGAICSHNGGELSLVQ